MVGLAGSLTRIGPERTHEAAIRFALGATPARAVRTIMNEGATLRAAGGAIGIGGARAIGGALRALHDVSPHDPVTLAAIAVFVGAASLIVCYLPARRAARIDPLGLLRGD